MCAEDCVCRAEFDALDARVGLSRRHALTVVRVQWEFCFQNQSHDSLFCFFLLFFPPMPTPQTPQLSGTQINPIQPKEMTQKRKEK